MKNANDYPIENEFSYITRLLKFARVGVCMVDRQILMNYNFVQA